MDNKRLILSACQGVLQPHGFARKGSTWNRKSDPLVDVVNVQVAKSDDAIALNVGVFYPPVFAMSWGTEPPRFPKEENCIVRTRLHRAPDGGDWWQLAASDAPGQVANALTTDAMAFFDRMHDLSNVEHFLEQEIHGKRWPTPTSVLYLGVLQVERSDKRSGCAILEQAVATMPGEWPIRFREVSSRLGCGKLRSNLV
jgi:hypothetical protein